MNNKKSTAIAAIIFLPILLCQPAHAQSLCNSLKKILMDARNEFKNYRGSFDFTTDEYEGTENIGLLDSCQTDVVAGVASYSCSLDDLPDNLIDVKTIFNKLDQEVWRCLGSSIKVNAIGGAGNSIRYDYLPEQDSIDLRYQRLTPKSTRRVIPPSYSIVISIDTLNPFKK